ncbi:MAG: Zinc carboxypeptidase [Bacteroidetes bacterium ADurb.Bin037]|nr:MAG: Zinc carboxypeptidase [Bacteroidetes bacterium ADurb.Bin037]HPW78728.1 M14 family zinc carboxypeptidase [Bacteroidales bacterium]HQB56231.1 M14 family zinc carboxypeptidase [Bacteroidales bacterium]
MKWLFILASLAAWLQEGRPVTFSTNFDSGSLGDVVLIDSVWVRPSRTDSVLHLSYEIISRLDPDNPANPELQPSGRWFFFRMENVAGKHIYLNFRNTDPKRAVYSYNGKDFHRFEHYQASLRKVSALFTCDTVYVAYFIPYGWDMLQQRLVQWTGLSYVTMDTLGISMMGLPIQMLTVTDPQVPEKEKDRIWIHARVHPSESPASWQLDGLLDCLTEDSPVGREYRRRSVFYVVPFTNPDGVYGGYSRSNARGINQEINWDHPDSVTSVEVEALRSTMELLTADKPFDLVLNVHAQSSDKASYYIHTAESTSEEYYRKAMLLANLTTDDNPYFFPEDMFYSSPAPRYVEGWIWNRTQGKTLALTIEMPYSYYNENPEGEWVTIPSLRENGEFLLRAISDYFQWNVPGRYILEGTPKGNRTVYRYDMLPAGTYLIYIWEDAWIPYDTAVRKRPGPFRYLIRSKEKPYRGLLRVSSGRVE